MPVSHAPLTPTIVPLLNDRLAFRKGQAANPVSGQEGLASLSVCDACLRAARRGEWVEVVHHLLCLDFLDQPGHIAAKILHGSDPFLVI
jgi:hypothetical protein